MEQGFDNVERFRGMEVGFGEGEGPLLKKGAFPLPNVLSLHYSFKNSRQRAECW